MPRAFGGRMAREEYLRSMETMKSLTPRAIWIPVLSLVAHTRAAEPAAPEHNELRIYERHGLHSVGWWVAEQKDAEGHDQFVCLLAGASTDAIQQSTTAFHRDAERRNTERETETDGKSGPA